MNSDRLQFSRNVFFIVELLAVSINFFVIYALVRYFGNWNPFDIVPGAEMVQQPHSLAHYMRAYWLALILWALILKWRKDDYSLRLQTYPRVAANLFISMMVFFCFYTSLAFILKLTFLSRAFLFFYVTVTFVTLFVGRMSALAFVHYIRSKGRNSRNLLLVGTGRRAQQFLELVAQHREWGYRVVGLLDQDPAVVGKKVAGFPVLGVLDDLPKVLETIIVDDVVVVVPRSWIDKIEKLIRYCEDVGIPVSLSTNFFDLRVAEGVPQEMDGFSYITFQTPRLKEAELLLKRLLDILSSSVALVLLSPVFVTLIFLIKITSDGSAFFKQTRCGVNGRTFTLYKFRSMVPGAEKDLDSLKAQNEMTGPVFKMENDPRVTPLGRFIRKTSLDEIPQFWNVFKGDMSVVGPRPPLPKEVAQYEPWQRRRLSMKPGITCLWQVSGRNKIGFEDWMKLDLQYIDRWSMWLDMKIMLLTVKAVLSRQGAK